MNEIIQYTANRLHGETIGLIELIEQLDSHNSDDIDYCLSINVDYLENMRKVHYLGSDMTIDALCRLKVCLEDLRNMQHKYGFPQMEGDIK